MQKVLRLVIYIICGIEVKIVLSDLERQRFVIYFDIGVVAIFLLIPRRLICPKVFKYQ